MVANLITQKDKKIINIYTRVVYEAMEGENDRKELNNSRKKNTKGKKRQKKKKKQFETFCFTNHFKKRETEGEKNKLFISLSLFYIFLISYHEQKRGVPYFHSY